MSRRIWMIVIGAGASLVALMLAVAESVGAAAPPRTISPAVSLDRRIPQPFRLRVSLKRHREDPRGHRRRDNR
jgi:hypothetical protein